MLNTIFDYEYIRDHNQTGWQQHWFDLLDGRWIVEDNELVEDANAKIFRIGFTVNDIEVVIGHQTGYLPTQVKWYSSQPERYNLIDGVYVQIDKWDNAINLQKAKDAIAAERYSRETSDLDYNGTLIFMDREARTTLEQTMDKIRRGVIPSSPYKCRNGWITLTPANVDEIELAGVQHVLNAFMWELAELQKLA